MNEKHIHAFDVNENEFDRKKIINNKLFFMQINSIGQRESIFFELLSFLTFWQYKLERERWQM